MLTHKSLYFQYEIGLILILKKENLQADRRGGKNYKADKYQETHFF